MPMLELPDASLHYIQRGKGPDIVWVPGGDNVAEDWEEQFAAFEGSYRNISFDPRGAGRTVSRREPPWLIEDFTADCAALIRAVCKPPVFVAGLSMGAKIVLQMALDHPDLVRAGIAMGVSGRPRGFLKDWLEAEVEFRRRGGRLSREFAVCHYAAFMYPSEVLGDDKLWTKVRPFVDRSYGEREGQFLAAQWQACIDYDITGRLPQCQVPGPMAKSCPPRWMMSTWEAVFIPMAAMPTAWGRAMADCRQATCPSMSSPFPRTCRPRSSTAATSHR